MRVIEGMLHWPVTFVYPEYQTSDFIEKFAEDVTLGTMLTNVFAECPAWDREKKYTPENMNVWIENRKTEKIYKIDINATLNHALREKNCYVYGGCPSFIITARDCGYEKNWLKRYGH